MRADLQTFITDLRGLVSKMERHDRQLQVQLLALLAAFCKLTSLLCKQS